jgi:hypothetical protein
MSVRGMNMYGTLSFGCLIIAAFHTHVGLNMHNPKKIV